MGLAHACICMQQSADALQRQPGLAFCTFASLPSPDHEPSGVCVDADLVDMLRARARVTCRHTLKNRPILRSRSRSLYP